MLPLHTSDSSNGKQFILKQSGVIFLCHLKGTKRNNSGHMGQHFRNSNDNINTFNQGNSDLK